MAQQMRRRLLSPGHWHPGPKDPHAELAPLAMPVADPPHLLALPER